VPATAHFWEHNRNKLFVALGLSALTIGHYLYHDGAEKVGKTLEHAVAAEYVPFIVLLFCLYTICGGIRIAGAVLGTPLVNSGLLLIGALLASFVGTTGASMLLIRPLLDFNSGRRHVAHTVIFFIFLVSNIGGSLLPIGDPPLFLGYLKGVPFLWTFTLWKEWLFCLAVLLVIYYVWDSIAFSRESPHKSWTDDQSAEALHFRGLHNLLFLAAVVAVVALVDGGNHPERPIPLTELHTPPYLREGLLLLITAAAWLSTRADIRVQNRFNFTAIIEVACLFIGIFITMQPAIEWLKHHGGELGVREPWQFFWATGTLSSFLDNAPTYLVFFETANTMTTAPGPGILKLLTGEFIREDQLTAISLGAVFMGANTYIGNGPNFMVKTIAEEHRVPMPGFFGYMMYSTGILVPLFFAVMVLFL
jgi:Na+/H+ antiporter NhaD/arsenite permease-like protein